MSGWWGFFERQQKSIKIAAILPESLMYSFFRVAFAQNKEYCWWPFPGFPWVVLLIMKSTIYSHIVDELRFCAFTESVFCVKLTQVLSCLTHRWVAFAHNVVYILLNIEASVYALFGVIVDATCYSIFGGFSTPLFLRFVRLLAYSNSDNIYESPGSPCFELFLHVHTPFKQCLSNRKSFPCINTRGVGRCKLRKKVFYCFYKITFPRKT